MDLRRSSTCDSAGWDSRGLVRREHTYSLPLTSPALHSQHTSARHPHTLVGFFAMDAVAALDDGCCQPLSGPRQAAMVPDLALTGWTRSHLSLRRRQFSQLATRVRAFFFDSGGSLTESMVGGMVAGRNPWVPHVNGRRSSNEEIGRLHPEFVIPRTPSQNLTFPRAKTQAQPQFPAQ